MGLLSLLEAKSSSECKKLFVTDEKRSCMMNVLNQYFMDSWAMSHVHSWNVILDKGSMIYRPLESI